MYISVCGIPGVGKSTFASLLSDRIGAIFLPEDPANFPLVSLAFDEPEVWSYPNQLQFVVSKVNDQLGLLAEKKHIIQECDALSTHALWTNVLQSLGHISNNQALQIEETLLLFSQSPMRKPDVYIFLRCPVNVVMERIHSRNRNYEVESDETARIVKHTDQAMWEFYNGLDAKKIVVDVEDIDLRVKSDLVIERLALVQAELFNN